MSSDHDHADRTLHDLAVGGLALVGHVNPSRVTGGADAGVSVGGVPGFEPIDANAGNAYFGEVDVRGDYAYLAQLYPPASVHVIDVSDPTAPREVGVWVVPSGNGGITDVKVSLDGAFVYAAYQHGQGDPNNGVFVIDVQDPTAPRTESHWSVDPMGVHMLFVQEFAGKEWVIAPTASAGGGAPIALAVDDPLRGGRALVPVTKWGDGFSPHDVYVYHDDILGVPLMVIANGASGVRIAPFAGAAAPVDVATWSYAGAPHHYAHTVRAAVVDGKRYVIVSPEGGALGIGSGDVAKLWVLDATDLANVKVAASWGNPGNHVAGSFMHSTHNFQLVGDRVYLAHNHGGVWILDFADAPDLQAVAYRLPAEHDETSSPWSSGIRNAIPAVWDVVLQEGYLYAADRSGGLYVMHYAEDELGPNGPTSYG